MLQGPSGPQGPPGPPGRIVGGGTGAGGDGLIGKLHLLSHFLL